MIKKMCSICMSFLSMVTSFASKKNMDKNPNDGRMEDERFHYEVCCSAPKLSPGEYISVEFIGESGTFRCFGSQHIGNGMGNGHNGVAGNSSSRYCLPKAIEAIWVSCADRKVYSFDSLIPYDTILALFRKEGELSIPTPSEEKTDVMNCLDLCFLPGGKVMLYVKAPAKSVLLDWLAKGEEVKDDKILYRIYKRYDGVNSMKGYYGAKRKPCPLAVIAAE